MTSYLLQNKCLINGTYEKLFIYNVITVAISLHNMYFFKLYYKYINNFNLKVY